MRCDIYICAVSRTKDADRHTNTNTVTYIKTKRFVATTTTETINSHLRHYYSTAKSMICHTASIHSALCHIFLYWRRNCFYAALKRKMPIKSKELYVCVCSCVLWWLNWLRANEYKTVSYSSFSTVASPSLTPSHSHIYICVGFHWIASRASFCVLYSSNGFSSAQNCYGILTDL